MSSPNLRIVVADQSEARFYEAPRAHAPLQPLATLSDPVARLHDRDLLTDRPGRVFDRAAANPAHRGSAARHGTAGERSPREHEAESFAQRIAAELERMHTESHFERLMLVAGPDFLGKLRDSLAPSIRALVVAELHKDLVHEPEHALGEQLASHWPAPPLR